MDRSDVMDKTLAYVSTQGQIEQYAEAAGLLVERYHLLRAARHMEAAQQQLRWYDQPEQ